MSEYNLAVINWAVSS